MVAIRTHRQQATAKFDLRSLIREQFEEMDDPSPARVAEMVLKMVPEEHLRDALAVCLPSYVMGIACSLRRTIPEPARLAPRLTPVTPATTYNRNGKRVTLTQRQRAAKAYQEELRWRVAVGGRRWKYLANCTKADLLKAASIRREQASGNIEWAERFERLAAALSENQTVSDLPDALRRVAIQ